MTTATSDTMTIAREVADLCRQGKNLEAIERFYADDIVSTEVCGDETMPPRMEGIDAVRGKNQWWFENHEVHGGGVTGPFPHGDQFILLFDVDVTPKAGPMAGKRMQMQEAGLYTVKDGKVVEERFFYDAPGM